jgi:hypothetical protein
VSCAQLQCGSPRTIPQPLILVYDAEAEPPVILRFVHQSRDLPAILDL